MNQSHGAVHHNGTDQILAFSVNHSTVVVQQQTPQQGCRSISPRDVGELLEIFLRVVPGALLARRSFERKKKGWQHAITRRTADANNEPCNYKRWLYFSTMRFESHAVTTTSASTDARMRVKKHSEHLFKYRWIDQEACCGNQVQLTRSTLPGEFLTIVGVAP